MQRFSMYTQKSFSKLLAFALTLLFIFVSIPVTAYAGSKNEEKSSSTKLKSLTYEEYIEQEQLATQCNDNNVSVDIQNDTKDNVMKSITELSEEKANIICENVNELTPLTNIESTVSATYTMSTVNLKPVAINTDSLKNGQITTDTQIAWIWDNSDENINNVTEHYLGGFPEAYYLGDLNNELGFVTQFDTPGHYTISYQEKDVSEELSEIVEYELDVVPLEDYLVIEENFSAENETQTYNVNVDFTNMKTAAFCFVRTGKSNASMTITDSTGKELAIRETTSANARRWYFLDKPSSDTTVETYTITVKATTYDASDSTFRLMVGSKKDAEAMISGRENAVWLDLFSETKNNDYRTGYTPNKDESWYRFTADGNEVFTLLTYYPQIRFQIRNVNSLDILYDSNTPDHDNAHKTKYCSAFGYAEKDRIALTRGQDYYLIIYAPSDISAQDFIEKTMNLAVGKPHMLSNSTTKYASSSLTATSSGYSSSKFIFIGDGGSTIPTTAVADTVKIQGSVLSNIDYWRVQTPSSSTWYNSRYTYPSINIGYVKDSNNNKNINGGWLISVRASSTSSPLTFVPGLYITYHYEIGD